MNRKKEVNSNQKKNHENAGQIMITEMPFAFLDSKISDLEKMLIEKSHNFETINYIYIVNKKKQLRGVLSIKEIFRTKKDTLVKSIMQKKVISVKTNTDQERTAVLSLKHRLKAIPVVDKENRLLGVIPFNVILDILHKEHIEDILYSAGIRKFKDPAVDIINASTKVHFKKRLPWLILGLFGGIIAAIIVGFFESILDSYIILAAFIPAVVYMADAVGAQAQTIFVRSIALDRDLNIKKYIKREINVNLLLGTILGILFYIIILIGWRENLFGIILGISIFSTVIVSMIIAIALPSIFNKLNFDPAISSGPFATAIRDLTSLLVYFGIASLMIHIYL